MTTPTMICADCENRRHYRCIDCQNDHSTHLCGCDCHDEKTRPHGQQEQQHDQGNPDRRHIP